MENKERQSKRFKLWHIRNKEAMNKKCREWASENKELMANRLKLWQKENKNKILFSICLMFFAASVVCIIKSLST